ncbi:hypothetical protein BSKO_11672 [Bryopsis sp. KO-2023]|nr:hypothetical protein BSKO_11672 [Bryopsis sp. KO-2023]
MDEESGHSLGSEVLVEKLSSTGNLLINRMQEERSSPAIQCDCRCSAFGVTLSGSQLDSLNKMIRMLKHKLAEMPDMGSNMECSGNQSNAMVPKKLSYGSLDVDMVLPEAPDSKLGIEFSLAAPKMRFVFEDTETADGSYFVGGNLPCSFVGVSQTVNIGVSLESSMDNISVSMQGFNLQDVGSYTEKKNHAKS